MNVENELVLKTLVHSCTMDAGPSSTSSSDSSGSDADLSLPKRRNLVRVHNFVEVTVQNYSDDEFKAHFRLNRRTVYRLIDELKASDYIPLHLDGRIKISAERALLLSVWYLSNEETFRQVSDRFNLTYSSAHRCLNRALDYLLSISSQVIKWPRSRVSIEYLSEGFKKIKGIENVIGAIDGSHIQIPKPIHNQDAYVNRKGYHSLLLQATVNHEKRFLDVFCGEPGSMHDARLLRKSAIFTEIDGNPGIVGNCFVIGDSAYPNLHWLVTPFKNNGRLTRIQKQFNYKVMQPEL